MLTSMQSASVIPEVNLRITQARKHTRNPHWLWKPRADVTGSSKQGYQSPHEKDLCPPKMYFKEQTNKKVLCVIARGVASLILPSWGYSLSCPDWVPLWAGSGTGSWTGPVTGLGGTPPGKDMGPEAEKGPATRDWGTLPPVVNKLKTLP